MGHFVWNNQLTCSDCCIITVFLFVENDYKFCLKFKPYCHFYILELLWVPKKWNDANFLRVASNLLQNGLQKSGLQLSSMETFCGPQIS